jgi:hypothetical protein
VTHTRTAIFCAKPKRKHSGELTTVYHSLPDDVFYKTSRSRAFTPTTHDVLEPIFTRHDRVRTSHHITNAIYSAVSMTPFSET